MKSTLLTVTLLASALISCDHDKSIAGSSKESSSTVSPDPAPPTAIPVTEPEQFKVAEEEPGNFDGVEPTPGQRLDHAIQKTEQGLGTAKEKTEEGVRKAAEATGGALRRAGEAIERKATESSR